MASLPLTYKGLALFTPGGDLIYCIDPTKQEHWHVQLCTAFEQVLDLSATPFFLSSTYAATIDRWTDPNTNSIRSVAEVKPRVWPFRPLLQAVFDTPLSEWQLGSDIGLSAEEALVDSYRSEFPELWQNHNLVVRLDHLPPGQPRSVEPAVPVASGYVLRLFVRGQSLATVQALEDLHRLLGQMLNCSYTLKIIDVQQHPELAEEDQISATPTLIKTWPPPVRRLIGRLDQEAKILRLLNLN